MLPRVLLGATRVLQSRHTVLLCSQILTQYACECVCKCVSSGSAVGGRDFACNTVMGLGQMSASSDAFRNAKLSSPWCAVAYYILVKLCTVWSCWLLFTFLSRVYAIFDIRIRL